MNALPLLLACSVPALFPSPALSSSQQRQQDLGDALGIPLDNPTPSVRDPTAHPKVNASTYHPPQSAVWNNAGKSRTNAQNGVREIQVRETTESKGEGRGNQGKGQADTHRPQQNLFNEQCAL